MGSPADDRTVTLIQYVLYILACLFVAGIVTWIIHLIRLSWALQDVPSASIGISIVAIPLFLTLLAVLSYLFWGLMRNRKGREEGAPEGGGGHKEDSAAGDQ